MEEEQVVISSLIVQAQPHDFEAISLEIHKIEGAEVVATDPVGKMIVVLEADTDRQLADTMKIIGDISGVYGVNMVFHHSEAAQ